MSKKSPDTGRSYTAPAVTNPPIIHDDGTVTIGPILVGVWATLKGQYRFVPKDTQVKSFEVSGEGKFIKQIRSLYDV